MHEDSRETIRLALRVLTTLADGGSCKPEDANALRLIAGDLNDSGAPLDDLACLVIHRERQALKVNAVTSGVSSRLTDCHPGL